MIADQQKVADELASGEADWIFLALVIDRCLLLIFIMSFAFGSCTLFYGVQDANYQLTLT
jgi:hypothetical protein